SLKAPLDEAQQALKEASASVGNLVDSTKAEIKADGKAVPEGNPVPESAAAQAAPEPAPQPYVHPARHEPPVDTPDPPAADTDTLPLPGFYDANKTKTGTPT